MLKKILFVIAFLCVVYGISQSSREESRITLLKEYKKAKLLYDEATALSTDPSYSEEKEIALNQQALQQFKALHTKLVHHVASYDSLFFYTSFFIGELEHYFEKYKEALNWYQRAISIHKQAHLPDSLLFKPFIYSGLILYNQNELNAAANFFHQAEGIQQKYSSPLEESQRLYNTWGVLSYETGNYRQAKNYFYKALETLSSSNPYYEALMVNYKINLAQIHFKLEEYDQANRIYQDLLPLKHNLNEIYLNQGLIYLNRGEPQTALYYFRKVSSESTKPVRLYNNIGIAFLAMKQFDSAHYYLDKALSYQSEDDVDNIGIGQTLKGLGDLENATGTPMKALHDYTAAIHRFYPAYTDTAISSNPKIFTGVFSYINLFDVLLGKAKAARFLYEKTIDPAWANEELEIYQSAFSLVDYVERTYNSDEARLFINKIKYEVHNRPIDIAFELYKKTSDQHYLEILYQVDQQNKASVLALNQQLSENRLAGDSSALFREKELKTAITRLSIQAARINDSAKLSSMNRQIRDLEINLAKVQNLQSGHMPIANGAPSISFLQKELLDRSTALISYHLSPGRLTTLMITKNEAQCFQQRLSPTFHDEIASYINSLHNSKPTDITLPSRKLYAVLFQNLSISSIDRLLIIPDDELNYLSFESLQDEKGSYLVERFAVQYQYSTAILKKQDANFKGHQTLSFAPFTNSALTDSAVFFDAIPNSLKEIELLEGKRFTGMDATKKAFIQNVSRFKVVHLATHAVAGKAPDQSFIVFNRDAPGSNDYLLYVGEIYNLSLPNTDLIILSACETGSGNLVKGEGIMSLSRAFTYAGCTNIITSLWKADDFSTAYLTQKVHQYLDQNFTIDRAVQQAKMDYLSDKGINPRLKHPYYWAHLVYIGNYHPSTSYFAWYITGAVILLLLVIFYFHFSKRTLRSKPFVTSW